MENMYCMYGWSIENILAQPLLGLTQAKNYYFKMGHSYIFEPSY